MRNKNVTTSLQDEVERIPECVSMNKLSQNNPKTELVAFIS